MLLASEELPAELLLFRLLASTARMDLRLSKKDDSAGDSLGDS